MGKLELVGTDEMGYVGYGKYSLDISAGDRGVREADFLARLDRMIVETEFSYEEEIHRFETDSEMMIDLLKGSR